MKEIKRRCIRIYNLEYERISEIYFFPKPKLKLRYYPSGTLGSCNPKFIAINLKAIYDLGKNINTELKRVIIHEFSHLIIEIHFREVRKPSHSKYFWCLNWILGNHEKNCYGYGKTNSMRQAEKLLKKLDIII